MCVEKLVMEFVLRFTWLGRGGEWGEEALRKVKAELRGNYTSNKIKKKKDASDGATKVGKNFLTASHFVEQQRRHDDNSLWWCLKQIQSYFSAHTG